MNPEQFSQLLQSSSLIGKEKKAAWETYHEIGIEQAVAFVSDINEKMAAHRKNLDLLKLPVVHTIFGAEYIDAGALVQMKQAARLPVALAGALMPDAHQGYGLPIGGVLATENAVIPYAVGVDIGCRMKITIFPESPDILQMHKSPEYKHLYSTMLSHTIFGSGRAGVHQGNIDHPILEESRWTSTPLIRSLRQTAIHQIGTSGGGNHFVEWGEVEITAPDNPLGLSAGKYLALLSHSGSRGVGYKIANHFTQLAMSLMEDLDASVKHLAWLPLDTEAGRGYWEAMELAGEFSSANHEVIHSRVARAAGLQAVASIENHHNFAWKEKVCVDGVEKEAIVHRKGATPAGQGVMGIIPGTMADFGYLVVGKGDESSLNSASHGSGRQMSRTQAKKTISHLDYQQYLLEKGVDLIGGGLDEAPQAYKPIEKVMEAQSHLVSVLGRFRPRIVRMASENEVDQPRSSIKGIVDGE